MKIKLHWQNPKIAVTPVLPIFIPYAGCPVRCIFCAQDIQSGTKQKNIKSTLLEYELLLEHRRHAGHAKVELGFFGGTFTAIADADLELCCEFVHKHIINNNIVSARCSTRPDALNSNILKKLKASGFNIIELGIQSFNNEALQTSKRNYTKETAIKACELVLEQKLDLGVQLMPGMPGVSSEVFLQDTKIALELDAKALRFYPCQVLKGTALAELWLQGKYIPWDFDQTVTTLSQAWLMAHTNKVPVIRMGLAPELKLEQSILAGPHHPALGSLVQAEAMFCYIQNALDGHKAKSITIPKFCQGFFGGQKNSLWQRWQELGVFKHNTIWHDKAYVEIAY